MEPPPAMGRKRARPAERVASSARLREDVLNLIHQTKSPLVVQQRRVSLAYDAAWRAFCRVVSRADDSDDAAAATRELTATLARLSKEATEVRATLLKKIASSVAAAQGNTRQQQRVLVWTWLGHTYGGRLWEMADVLVAVASSAHRRSEEDSPELSSGSVVNVWLRTGLQALLEAPAVEVRLQRRLSLCSDSDSLSESIVKYIVRVAFQETTALTPNSSDEPSRSRGGDAGVLALAALQAIGSGCHTAPRLLVLVVQGIAQRIKQKGSNTTALRAFLRAQVKDFLLAHGMSHQDATAPRDDTEHILATFQSCVPAADTVQLFRQVWTEAKTSGDPWDPIDWLAPLIASSAQRDDCFRAHALATAHDLASEAVSASDALMLRHSLELAAAATVGPSDEDGNVADAGYGDWFRAHFAAGEGQSMSASSVGAENSRHSLSGNSSVTHACLRATGQTLSSNLSGHPVCNLVSTKRHLQFVCAFLLEFDRIQSQRRRAHHVFAHLSAMKTHHALNGSAVGGLLSDFCSQTRERHSQLESQEHEATTRSRRRRLSSMSSIRTTPSVVGSQTNLSLNSSQYDSSTRGGVEELLELYARDQTALVALVNQKKMFEPIVWKNKILPCCLDLEYWHQIVSSDHCTTEDGVHQVDLVQRQRTAELAGLVQLLAKHHAVGTLEYTAFLERLEEWFVSLQRRASVHLQHTRQSNEHHVTSLNDAIDRFFDVCLETVPAHLIREQASQRSWAYVTTAFVCAFEGLVDEPANEQLEQMQRIYDAIVRRCAKEAMGKNLSIEQAVENYTMLWISLLSHESHEDVRPEERMRVMEAYCTRASQHVTCEVEDRNGRLAMDERLVEMILHGCLLGLLASMAVCETLARSASLTFCTALEPKTAEPSVDDLVHHLKRSSAFLSGFLRGFFKNPTDHAPQSLLQSMLTPPMRECLIWVGHHTNTWWNTEFATSRLDTPTNCSDQDPFWSFVQLTLQSAYDHHGWFRLTFSPGVFTTKDQWQVFVAMELTCCVTQLLCDGRSRVNLVEFVSRQHEQMSTLMLSSAGGQTAGVRTIDVCIWIVQATLELAASTPPVESLALDALVLLLKDVWSTRVIDASGASTSPSDVLGFLMEMTLQLTERFTDRRSRIVHHAIRCAKVVITEGQNGKATLVDISPVIIRQFVELVALAAATILTPVEWASVLWCIVLKLQHSSDIYATANEIPPSVFAHWAYDFPRLCRMLTVRKNGKVSHATNAALLRTLQTCFEFFRTLNVHRLAPSPPMTLFGVSASQYVPSSAADDTMELHVRAIEWLIASDLVETPPLERSATNALALNFETSLAFHSFSTRVLGALLEDMSIGRPEDIAVELTEICQNAWLASMSEELTKDILSRSRYQLLLVHMVADLAARHASVGRFLLRSSSEILDDSRRGLFLLMALAASKETDQLDSLLKLNGSLWVNTFIEVACSLADLDDRSMKGSTGQVVTILRHCAGFENQLAGVLTSLLNFAALKQIDLLDSSLIARVEKLFPTLRELLSRVPVLNLASAALSDW